MSSVIHDQIPGYRARCGATSEGTLVLTTRPGQVSCPTCRQMRLMGDAAPRPPAKEPTPWSALEALSFPQAPTEGVVRRVVDEVPGEPVIIRRIVRRRS